MGEKKSGGGVARASNVQARSGEISPSSLPRAPRAVMQFASTARARRRSFYIRARVTTAARNYERQSCGFSAAARISLRSGTALVCLTKRLNELPETRVSGKSGGQSSP